MIYLYNYSGYAPPHRHTVQRRLSQLYLEHKTLLIEQLANVPAISVTCDLWSDKRLFSYICLTGHYIKKDFDLVSQVIEFSSFSDRHHSNVIGHKIKTILNELNIYDKITVIVTDGASNMVKTFDTYCSELERLHCKFI